MRVTLNSYCDLFKLFFTYLCFEISIIMSKRTLISFDWATKKLLRQKANFGILEGFLSELLKEDIYVNKILESESNKSDEDDKYNVVDLLCEDVRGELIIIEIQFYSELDYFHRVLFGVSKAITEYMKSGDSYAKVKKVYSVNIVYFDLGHGDDYIYHGKTRFTGMHNNDELTLSKKQQKTFGKETPGDIYPEIYLLKVNNFNDVAKSSLDEWIYFLKNTKLPKNFKAKGLIEVEQQLNYDKMNTKEKSKYDEFIKSRLISKSMLETAIEEGMEIGMEKGMEKGRAVGRDEVYHEKIDMILTLHQDGVGLSILAKAAKLTEEEVLEILKKNKKE